MELKHGHLTYRTLFKGEFSTVSTTTETQEDAQVYTNSSAGEFSISGEVTTNTITNFNSQQYSYFRNLGLTANAKYYYLKSLYVGANASWYPVQWQSGQMVSAELSIEDLEKVTTRFNSLDIAFNLGLSIDLNKKIMLDAGLIYTPTQFGFELESIPISLNSIGGNVRTTHMF